MPLKVNDKIVWITDDSLEYGVVKWIGQLPEGSEVVAGIEFVSSFGNGSFACITVHTVLHTSMFISTLH